MASVIRERRNGKTLYAVQYVDEKRRRKLSLGGANAKTAKGICAKIEALLAGTMALGVRGGAVELFERTGA